MSLIHLKKLALASGVGLVVVASAGADTLVMRDGRTYHGELVAMNRRIIQFDQETGGPRDRRVRVDIDDVARIEFDDHAADGGGYVKDPYFGGDRGYGSGYGRLERTVSVAADRAWTDTGIEVRAGDTIHFDAAGSVSWGPGRTHGPAGEVSSHYNPRRPVPNAAGGALIARVGGGEPFVVATERGGFRVNQSGRLYLGVNDDYLADNSGSFRVTITQ